MPGPATRQLGHHPTSNWPTPRCTTPIPASTVATWSPRSPPSRHQAHPDTWLLAAHPLHRASHPASMRPALSILAIWPSRLSDWGHVSHLRLSPNGPSSTVSPGSLSSLVSLGHPATCAARCSSEKWCRNVQCRTGADYHLFFTIYCLCLPELPSTSCVVVRRGDHQHDDAGSGSGRVWKPAQELVAPTHVSSLQRPTSEGFVATLRREPMDESLLTRNQISNLFETKEKRSRSNISNRTWSCGYCETHRRGMGAGSCGEGSTSIVRDSTE